MTLPDILAPGLSAVFCGINPGQRAACIGQHFAGRGNRFWPALHLAGFTPVQLSPAEDVRLLEYGYGLTTAAPRASRTAAEVNVSELRAGLRDLEAKIRQLKPRVVAFLGKPAWIVHTGKAYFSWGRQTGTFGGSEAWVLPNPSGLNRHFSLVDLARAYRELRVSLSPAADGLPT
ncbi:G/U mismatch-specific DNA glycosylase [Luteibacter yeojuensis]|uniref:G/U mismatch-specific DNA glycosylase n=1 Tax=Luteibacter yeojuensis TaxID=345309 RepID=A0A7X5QSH0_9GAMM|nr:G/U mismatch-specific DNA glycosylase [Luteibacter yeojuensis]NID14588.1 G/U mismatch-specific DNA glycosylase [Luteibacter yeojuensis]